MLKFALAFALVCSVMAAKIMPGGYVDIEVDRDDVVEAAKEATKTVGEQLSRVFHTKLGRVVKAQSQVVAGVNFKLTIVVGLTNCKKEEVEFEDVDGCEYQDGDNTYHKCQVVVFHGLNGNHSFQSSCSGTSENDL